jgi:phage N-6-adenine-methyltransferase
MATSNKDSYETPQDLFDALNSVFKFDLDLCATSRNAKTTYWCGDIFDSFWDKHKEAFNTAFMNPPYSKPGKFIERALELKFKTLVMLLPVDCTTEWWKLLTLVVNDKIEQLPNCCNEFAVTSKQLEQSGIFLLPKRVKFYDPNTETFKDVSRGNCIVVVNS